MLFPNILYAIIACTDDVICLNPSQNSLLYHGGAAEASGSR